MPGKIILKTRRLIICEYSVDDIPYLHRILSDPVTMSFWPEPFSLDQTAAWIERSMQSYIDNGFGRYAVKLKSSDSFVGDAGILQTEVNGKTENDIGYIIHNAYWNNGYGAEAAAAILRWGLESIGLSRIAANMACDHKASVRVAEKIGMKKELEFINKRNRNIQTFLYSKEK